MSSSPTDTTAQLVDITMPQMGVSVAEGTIVAWRVEVGDRVEADQTLCDISTDKIETEVPSPTAGIIAEILVAVEETVEVGVVLARLAVGDGAVVPAGSAPAGDAPAAAPAQPAPAAAAPAPAARPTTATPAARPDGRRYSPVVQRIAAEHGIDLASVSGTGRGGRVRKQDVLALVNGNGDAAGVEDPPLHIESPYRPDPPPPWPRRPHPLSRRRSVATACRGCAARSAST